MGTIGGSIANNDPAADYPAAALALGATIVTNKRRIPAQDFFTVTAMAYSGRWNSTDQVPEHAIDEGLFDLTKELVGSREATEVFMLAAEGQMTDLPSASVLRKRVHLLAERFVG